MANEWRNGMDWVNFTLFLSDSLGGFDDVSIELSSSYEYHKPLCTMSCSPLGM